METITRTSKIEKPTYLPLSYWVILSILLLVSLPSKILSLLFFVMIAIFALIKYEWNQKNSLIILILILFNTSFSLYFNGMTFIVNALLFFFFISPWLLFIMINKEHISSYSPTIIKLSIETYLIIQIIFSLFSTLYRLSLGYSLDVNFGDIIAGTFRMPFTYTADSSNVMFTFLMILLLFIYIVYFGRKTNKLIVTASLFIIFLASVNHLILAAIVAMSIAMFWKHPLKITMLILVTISLYMILQPGNFNMILSRLSLVFDTFNNYELLSTLSLKGEYLFNFFQDFMQFPEQFLITGTGAGTYSSRAAMFATGEYVGSFSFSNISELMQNNTYDLWQILIDRPPWLAGAFHYPYASTTSFVAELGLIGSIVFFGLFYITINKNIVMTFEQKVFLFVFLFLSGMIDNYYEYFQATFIFFFIIWLLPRKIKIDKRKV